ncbi:ABC transporter permease subunit [Candidatus Bipolaricaulota bacterium]|nr:ABC transporter permease subunit [Candidatus Bipolaricaulota bacterium]
MRKFLSYFLAVFVIFLAWALASWIIVLVRGRILLPYPWDTFAVGFAHRGEFLAAFGASARRFALSLALAFATGLPLGLVIGASERLNRWLSPLIYLLYPVPPVALLIILYMIFGIGEAVKVVVIAATLFFQILVASIGAARNISPSHILSVLSAGANVLQLHRHVVLPAVLPDVFTAARVSVGLGITILYIAETMLGVMGGPASGLGNFTYTYTMRPDLSMAGVVGLSLLGLGFYALLEILERWICRWRYAGKSEG